MKCNKFKCLNRIVKEFKARNGGQFLDVAITFDADDIKEIEQLITELSSIKPKTDVLDNIRAEIEQTADEEQKYDEKWAIGLRHAVKIIDKYKTEKE